MEPDLFIEKSAVVGGGLMGSQIALVLALGSRETVLVSRRQETLDQAMDNIRRGAGDLQRHELLKGETAEAVSGRIRTTTELEEAVGTAQFVVESITENLEAKQEVFRRMDAAAPRDTVLASNTSGLPITRLGERMAHPDRIAGSHFFQPAHIVPVLEVIRGNRTSDEAMDRSCEIWRRLDKIPLRVEKDVPGFLCNRLQHAVICEAVNLLVTGVADAESIDLAVELGLAPRFTTAGPPEAARHQRARDARERGRPPVETPRGLGGSPGLSPGHGRARRHGTEVGQGVLRLVRDGPHRGAQREGRAPPAPHRAGHGRLPRPQGPLKSSGQPQKKLSRLPSSAGAAGTAPSPTGTG